jgi:hypothetical protein
LRMPTLSNKAILDIRTKITVRAIRQLLILFELNQYDVFYKSQWNKITLALANVLDWHKNTRIVWTLDKKNFTDAVYVTDRIPTSGSKKKFIKKNIVVNFKYGPEQPLKVNEFVMPMQMHPQIYTQYQGHVKLDQFRKNKKKGRLLFSGNWDKSYKNDVIEKKYAKISRPDIIEFLLTNNLAVSISDVELLKRELEAGYKNQCFVLDSKARLDQSEWLELISFFDFFLSPPGILLPLTHNFTESISVGTIPLTNCYDWYYPHPVNLESCIRFDTLEELKEKIEFIQNMNESSISNLRIGAIDFYEKNVSLGNFFKKMMDCESDIVHLRLWEETEARVKELPFRSSV